MPNASPVIMPARRPSVAAAMTSNEATAAGPGLASSEGSQDPRWRPSASPAGAHRASQQAAVLPGVSPAQAARESGLAGHAAAAPSTRAAPADRKAGNTSHHSCARSPGAADGSAPSRGIPGDYHSQLGGGRATRPKALHLSSESRAGAYDLTRSGHSARTPHERER